MAISYIYTGEPMTGTANDDFFIAFKGSTGTDNNTINGNGGDDWVFADSSDTWIPNASYLNGSIATAFNFETLTSTWTTAENAMFGDFTVPHTTAIVETTIGQSEFFRVAIGAGQQITIDIDFASNTAIGNPRDLVVELQDSLGNVIATADDSLISQGGLGSFPSAPGSASSYDPYLTYTVPSAGIYYINVRPFGGGPGSTFTENNTFVMNVSVTGHATSASNPVQGNDIINGGEGDDALMGGGGDDTINGGIGNDTIDGGSGGDIVHGDAGDDVLYGGDGTEENIHGDDGNDTLISGGEGHYYGDAGDDVIHAGLTAGVNEILDGGTDVDTIDTTTWNGSYVINLVTGTTNFGESFINFENVVSGNGADTITGTDGANVITTKGGIDTITAGAGNDTVSGGADGDTLDGGAGVDILDYRTSNGAVTINLATNTANGGHASGDIISNFEGVRGSVLGDHLTGGNGPVKLYGFEGNDTLTGGNGNDVLDGGINDDVMTGGLGNDTYYVDSLGDTVNELLGEGTDTMALGFSYVLANGSAIERLATIDPLATVAIDLTGNSSANMLTGNGGANTLNGGAGADTMIGGLGNDTYVVDNVGDVVTEIGVGTDTVRSTITFTLGANVENLTLTGAAAIDGTGNTLANPLTGNGAANTLIGLGGNDTLNGGAGVDTMIGGLGNDTYVVDNVGDVVTETGVGTDTVQSKVTFTLGVNVENLTLTGGAAINGTGNALANILTGNNGANTLSGLGGDDTLDGGGGVDTMIGGLGNDIYVVDNVGDVVTEDAGEGTDLIRSSIAFTLGANVENLTLTGGASIDGTGNTLANILTGNGAANMLNGLAGADTMIGGLGNDTYVVDDVGDVVTETGVGTDTVRSTITFTLGANVENLTLTGGAAINGIGNTLANILIGNGTANTLNGGTGADTMIGGLGGDIYVVDNVGDVVTETGAGIDAVQSTVTFTLGANVENLTLTGGASINGTGNALANVLTGNGAANTLSGLSGNDTLNGGGGADTMIGGLGNDIYVVDTVGDVVTENAGEGTDLIQSSIAFTLGANVENLTLTGGASIDGTGNTLANTLIGNGAANILNGGSGADTMIGGLGNDIYVVDNVGDVVTETGVGADTVQSTVSFTLGVNVENLTLTGGASIDGTGNALVNKLLGNTGNNILDGGSGADTMIGGLGNDTYVVDNVGDVVTETGAGIDLVESLKTFTLGANVENLTLAGVSSIDGTGNGLANILTGNSAANILSGLSGNDQIIAGMGNDNLFGGGGNDDLTGGAGLDRFRFDTSLNAATNVDDILDFSVADDAIFLDRDIFIGIAADGTLAASAFVNGTAAGDANDRIIYDGTTGNIFYDADGSAGGAQTLFATVTVGTALTNVDFFGYI